MGELKDPEIFRAVLDSLHTGVYVTDRNGKILLWNRGAEQITGHMRHDVVGRTCRNNILVHCNDQGCVACGATCPSRQTLHEGRPKETRIQLRHKQGHPIPVLMRSVPLRDEHGSIIGLAESFDERRAGADRERNSHQLLTRGFLDEITGLPNHALAQSHLQENLEKFTASQVPFSVLCLHIDHLEHLRAADGRQASDAIVRVVAQTLRDSFRPTDFLGRWSEDEFLAILSNCGSTGLERVTERIQKAVACAGIQWWGEELSATTSVAGSATTQSGDTIDLLLTRAQLSRGQVSAAGADNAGAGSHKNPRNSES